MTLGDGPVGFANDGETREGVREIGARPRHRPRPRAVRALGKGPVGGGASRHRERRLRLLRRRDLHRGGSKRRRRRLARTRAETVPGSVRASAPGHHEPPSRAGGVEEIDDVAVRAHLPRGERESVADGAPRVGGVGVGATVRAASSAARRPSRSAAAARAKTPRMIFETTPGRSRSCAPPPSLNSMRVFPVPDWRRRGRGRRNLARSIRRRRARGRRGGRRWMRRPRSGTREGARGTYRRGGVRILHGDAGRVGVVGEEGDDGPGTRREGVRLAAGRAKRRGAERRGAHRAVHGRGTHRDVRSPAERFQLGGHRADVFGHVRVPQRTAALRASGRFRDATDERVSAGGRAHGGEGKRKRAGGRRRMRTSLGERSMPPLGPGVARDRWTGARPRVPSS